MQQFMKILLKFDEIFGSRAPSSSFGRRMSISSGSPRKITRPLLLRLARGLAALSPSAKAKRGATTANLPFRPIPFRPFLVQAVARDGPISCQNGAKILLK